MNKPAINLAEMSDDQINNLDPSTLKDEEVENKSGASGEEAKDKPAAGTEAADAHTEGTGGAASEDDSDSEDSGGEGSASDDAKEDTSTEQKPGATTDQPAAADQAAGDGTGTAKGTADSSGEIDYKAEFSKVMAPFKAAKREIRLTNTDDARRLMQMGVDYSRKMEAMKPHQRIIKTLEKAGLLNVEEINFLIDLKKKNPEAIRKFLKDSEIDPMDLSLEGESSYKPTDHAVRENELALDEILDEIRGTDAFTRTVDVITNEWDTASRKILLDNPGVIRILNDHMSAGIYDQIASKVAEERVFGRLTGLSDLDAYKAVGDAMHKSGGFKNTPNSRKSSANGNTSQDSSQDSGSDSAEAENLRNRKRAASPTKGNASTRKPVVNIMGLSDEEILKIDHRAL